jgi:hypothetical protein
MRAKRLIGLFATLLVAGTALTTPAHASTTATYLRFKNQGSQKCIAVPGGNPAKGVKLIQYGCTGGAQEWQVPTVNPGKQINGTTGKCMAVPGGTGTEGVQIIQWDCGDGHEQLWDTSGVTTSSYDTIVNNETGQCLAVAGGSHADGAAIVQFRCEPGHPEQRWTRIP